MTSLTNRTFSQLLNGLLGTTMFGISAVAAAQLPSPARSESVAADSRGSACAVAVVPQFSAEWQPEARSHRIDPPLLAPIATPESFAITSELSDAEYLQMFADLLPGASA